MKPQLLKVSTGPAHSFSVRQDLVPHVNNKWHYHPEVELVHFKNGSGTQFIGDNIQPFKSGDVVLVGAHLPHYWRFNDTWYEEDGHTSADTRVVHFCENFWGDHFLLLPENTHIRTLLEKARHGIQVTGEARQHVAALMERLLHAEGTERIIYLMEALFAIAHCKELAPLSSIGFKPVVSESENDRINAIYEYSLTHFKRKIQLEEIAGVANISPNSFCRYFKARTRKTYSKFLIEIRVGHACKLLIENKLSIKQLCYESGFNNFACFHKYFKDITGKSPLKYQREFVSAQ